MIVMGLKSFLEIFDFLEIDEYGAYSIIWSRLIKASIIIFLFVTFLATLILVAMDNVFPEETVYMNVWHSNDTDYHVRINASTDYFANNFIKDVILDSSQLNISDKRIQLNDHHNLNYVVKVPRELRHFVIHVYFETYFPFPPKKFTIDVTRV